MSRRSSANESPQPIQTAPITVAEIDAVGACRVSAIALEHEREREARSVAPPTIQPMSPICAPTSASIAADVAGRRERASGRASSQNSCSATAAADRDQHEQPPAAEVHGAEHDRQRDRHDEQPRDDVAHSLPAAEASPAARVLLERAAQVARVEVRPEPVDEDELRVRELPEHEVRDAQLAARADQQVGVGQLRRVEVLRDDVLVDLARVHPALGDAPRRPTSSARPP